MLTAHQASPLCAIHSRHCSAISYTLALDIQVNAFLYAQGTILMDVIPPAFELPLRAVPGVDDHEEIQIS
jgi:hypothetical protein